MSFQLLARKERVPYLYRMQEYRAYQIDTAGNIIGPAMCFECAADEAAIEKARAELDGYAIEIWAGDRRVGFAVPRLGVSKAG